MIKLEEGKYYESAAGDKWGPVEVDDRGSFFASSTVDPAGWFYDEDGEVSGYPGDKDRLVTEWVE